MSPAISKDPRLPETIEACLVPLKRLAGYTLDPVLDHRIQKLGEGKEFLTEDELAQLMALVRFVQQRSVEKLQAQLALQKLEELFLEGEALA